MKLILRNKTLLAVAKTIEESVKIGGVPAHFILGEQEAIDFLKEVHYFKTEDTSYDFPIEVKSMETLVDLQDTCHPEYLVRILINKNITTSSLSDQTLHALIVFWKHKRIEVKYDGISLVLIHEKEPKMPPNRLWPT